MFAIGIGCLLATFLLVLFYGRDAPDPVKYLGGGLALFGLALLCMSVAVALYRWGGMP